MKAWGKRHQCQRTEEAKALLGKASDPTKCRIRFDTAAAKFDETASEKHVPCRYLDGGDGTITDTTTGLMWQVLTEDEQVTGHGWYEAMGDHVSSWNGWSPDGTSLYPVCATYSDWRVPTVVELASIVDLDAQGCGFGGPCIDPIFGPTYAGFAWSSTTDSTKFSMRPAGTCSSGASTSAMAASGPSPSRAPARTCCPCGPFAAPCDRSGAYSSQATRGDGLWDRSRSGCRS